MLLTLKRKSIEASPVHNFKRLKIDSFENLKVGQLRGFIAVRLAENSEDLRIEIKKLSSKKFLNKGCAEKAILGEDNLVSLAFGLRSKDPIFKIKLDCNESTPIEEIGNADPILAEATSFPSKFQPEKSKELMPSEVFMQKSWKLANSSDFFDPSMKSRIADKSMKESAVELLKLISIRLIARIKEKVDHDKKNHWCWKFTKMSIPVISSIIVLMDYATSIDAVNDAISNKHA